MTAAPAAAQVLAPPPTPVRLVRWEEDWRDPALRGALGPFAPLKLLRVADDPAVALSLGAELRERFETASRPLFGLPGTPRSDAYLLHRMLLHADLRMGEGFRAFVQLGDHRETGRSPRAAPTDVDSSDLQQGFLEVATRIGPGWAAGARAGRQELTFGSARLVDVREGPNVRLGFDGVRAFVHGGDMRLDAFAARPVSVLRGRAFDDRGDGGQAFWGVYGTAAVPPFRGMSLDLYYFGLERERAPFDAGVADERRHTIGARAWGRAAGFDWDVEAVFQFGRFGARDIRAWTVASDFGWTAEGAAARPRLGLKANASSGGSRPGTLRTFYPLFPKFAYFTEAALNAPINLLDVFPSVNLALRPDVGITFGVDLLWRQDTGDAFYTSPGVPLVTGNANGRRYLGLQSNVQVQWQATPTLNLNAAWVRFATGGFLSAAGARDVDFLALWASFRV